ncbi:hypothetical protein [[Mycobacterium] nativiensis]|uniref:Porin n=1 Tax=[Mycobacterium] nativiensis TaxID=2855503 RepID=A0ABU5Y271_9MYCO|nr:hypothetical protein [Mycolicibacter sp. MYC340]MEB3034322.1 hypothetical protein [Mycolicibacter sp. MYC340]
MSIRKIGVIGSFAAGAALALAPLAAAAGDETPTPPDFSDILAGQVKSMNWLFETQAKMAGFDADLITKGDPTSENPLSFDTIAKADLLESAAFGKLLYGVNWEDEIGSVPGSFSLFNGALTQFNDANNVLMYALMTGGDEIQLEDAGSYLFGSESGIEAGLAGDGFFADFSNFFQAGVADLGGYFGFDI